MAKIGDKIGGKKIISICGLNIYFEDCSWITDTSQVRKPKKVLKKNFKDDKIIKLNESNSKINKDKTTETLDIKKDTETTPKKVNTETKTVQTKTVETKQTKEEIENNEFLKHVNYSGMK